MSDATRGAASARFLALADTWAFEAQKRRKLSAHDVGADILAYCADELRSELADTSDADTDLSAAEYAALHGVSTNTVRRWCQSGALPARAAGRGWRIRCGEKAPNLRAVA